MHYLLPVDGDLATSPFTQLPECATRLHNFWQNPGTFTWILLALLSAGGEQRLDWAACLQIQ